MLTNPEKYASCMMGAASKCEQCKHGSNVTFNGVHTCKHGLSPKYCAIYEDKPEIALRKAQEVFK